MKKIIFIFYLIFFQFGFAQSKLDLPFVGMRTFSFCGGNACEWEIKINKNGNCTIVSYGFMREEKYVEYKGKYKKIIWIYENGKKSYGYKIVGKNIIFHIGLNGKAKKDCFKNQICQSYLYYVDKNGHVRY